MDRSLEHRGKSEFPGSPLKRVVVALTEYICLLEEGGIEKAKSRQNALLEYVPEEERSAVRRVMNVQRLLREIVDSVPIPLDEEVKIIWQRLKAQLRSDSNETGRDRT